MEHKKGTEKRKTNMELTKGTWKRNVHKSIKREITGNIKREHRMETEKETFKKGCIKKEYEQGT